MNNEKKIHWNKELIDKYVNENQFEKLNIQDKNGNTGFMVACINQPDLAIKMLERKDINFNIQNDGGNTGFMLACRWQPVLALKMLERKDIDFNIQCENGNSGFMWACAYQPKLIIPLLENKNIDTTLKNNDGKTGWDFAKEYNSEGFKIYQSFLENKKLSNNISTKISKPKTLL